MARGAGPEFLLPAGVSRSRYDEHDVDLERLAEFRTMGKHVPPPVGVKPPFRWGTQEGLDALMGEGSLQARRRSFVWRFRSARHHVEFMRGYYGPLGKAFETLDEEGQNALEHDLISLVQRYNRSDDGAAVWPADYLEVVATRR